MDVSLEDAYREACLALGEGIVRERLLAAEVQRLTETTAASTREAASPS